MRSLRGSLSDGTGVSSALFAAGAKEHRSPKYFDHPLSATVVDLWLEL